MELTFLPKIGAFVDDQERATYLSMLEQMLEREGERPVLTLGEGDRLRSVKIKFREVAREKGASLVFYKTDNPNEFLLVVKQSDLVESIKRMLRKKPLRQADMLQSIDISKRALRTLLGGLIDQGSVVRLQSGHYKIAS